MQVALYARVSTPNQQQEGTIASQVHALKHYIHQQGWSLLPELEYIDEGISGARLDRPALDRLRAWMVAEVTRWEAAGQRRRGQDA